MANEGKKTFSLDVDLKAEVDAFLSDNALSHNNAMRLMLSAAKSQMMKLNESKRASEIDNVQNLAKQLVDCFIASWTYNENAEGRIRAEYEDELNVLHNRINELESESTDLIEEVQRLRTSFIERESTFKSEVDELKKAKDAEIDNLKNDLNSVNDSYAKLEKEHMQMSKLLTSIEENKSRLEADIEKLKSADERVKELEKEIESLKESRFEYAENVRDKALFEAKESHKQVVQAKDEQISSLKSIIEELKNKN